MKGIHLLTRAMAGRLALKLFVSAEVLLLSVDYPGVALGMRAVDKTEDEPVELPFDCGGSCTFDHVCGAGDELIVKVGSDCRNPAVAPSGQTCAAWDFAWKYLDERQRGCYRTVQCCNAQGTPSEIPACSENYFECLLSNRAAGTEPPSLFTELVETTQKQIAGQSQASAEASADAIMEATTQASAEAPAVALVEATTQASAEAPTDALMEAATEVSGRRRR